MSKPEYQIIQEERERAERNMTGDLASMGVSVSKQHFTLEVVQSFCDWESEYEEE